jgi:hypothetical protein
VLLQLEDGCHACAEFPPSLPPLALEIRRTDSHDRVLDIGRLWLGSAVVAVGVLFLLDAAGVLSADRAIERWWPLLLLTVGLLTPASLIRGTLLTGAGAVPLLFTTDVVEGNSWDYVWPALLIGVGLVIVVRWHGRTIPTGASEEDVIRSTAVFGGPKLVCTSHRFHGAWLPAIFGGITLDLRNAVPAPEGATVTATVAIGGVDVLMPKCWRLSVRSTSIFGGPDDKTDHSEAPAEEAPMLHIDAVTVFGGVDIKHTK